MKKSFLMVISFGLVALLWSCGPGGSDGGGSGETRNGSWIRVAKHAEFSPRDMARGFVFLGKMWISNGYRKGFVFLGKKWISNGYRSGGLCDRDLWSSDDGIRWTKVLDETPYSEYSGIVVYNGKLWAISQSVWSSENGVDWVRILDRTPFADYWCGKVVVHDGKMWYLGHGAGVWWSIDGENWTCAIREAPFGDRAVSAVAAFDGKLWLMGGMTPVMGGTTPVDEKEYPNIDTHNDVWSSTDGINWTKVTEHAQWEPRMWFIAETYAGYLWVIGGFDNDNVVHFVNFADAWYTADGANWTKFKSDTWWSARHEPTSIVFDNSLWIVAGNSSRHLMNDVWRLTQ